MFSQLGPLFKTVFRSAEPSDARLEIRREEKENEKQKKEEKTQELDENELWQDSTEVSVGALRTFLIDFLKSKGDVFPEERVDVAFKKDVHLPSDNSSRTSHTVTARAHKAYAAMSMQSLDLPLGVAGDIKKDKNINLSDMLKTDEVRAMYGLIAELDNLAKYNIQSLKIEKADSFLQALVIAVENAKRNL